MYRHLKPASRITSALKKRGTYSRRQRGRSYPLHYLSRSYPDVSSLRLSGNEDDSDAVAMHRHPVRRSISSLSKEAATCAVDTPVSHRWWAVPPANAVHLAIGSVYVYSMWTPGMTHVLGVVSASSLDWTHGQVLPVFSASAVCLGLTVRICRKIVMTVVSYGSEVLHSSSLVTRDNRVQWITRWCAATFLYILSYTHADFRLE
jgi:hypothetical protein